MMIQTSTTLAHATSFNYNDNYYIISEHLKRAHWVQNIIHNPRVLFTVNEKRGLARF
jgi:hypothetical protein